MTFNIIQNSTSTDQVAANENFYHIAQGSVNPKGGTSLADTTSVYDLGSDTYRFNTLFCGQLKAQTISSNYNMKQVSSVTLTASADTINITGITVTASHYRLYGCLYSETAPTAIIYLNASGTSTSTDFKRAYYYTVWGGATAAATYVYQDAPGLMWLQLAGTTIAMVFDYYVYFQSTTTIIKENVFRNTYATPADRFILDSTFKTGITVTGFYITAVGGTFAAGSYVSLWKSE